MSELEISRVGGQEASCGAAASKANLRVDVKHASSSARRPDNRGGIGLVVLEVVAVDWANERVFGGGLL